MSQPKKCGALTQRNAKRISTSKGSWGWGPNKEAFKRKPTDKASWGGPQQREFRQEIPQAKEVGFQQKNYVKIVPCF